MEQEEKVKGEDKIRSTIQSSVAMQQCCTHGPRQLFLSCAHVGGGGGRGRGIGGREKGGGGGGEKGGGEKGEGGGGGRGGGERGGGGGEESGEDHNCNAVFHSSAAELYLLA